MFTLVGKLRSAGRRDRRKRGVGTAALDERPRRSFTPARSWSRTTSN